MSEEKKPYKEYLEYTPLAPPTPKYFVSIPVDIIAATEVPVQRISCFYYILQNLTPNETVMYCPTYMIQFCGYKGTWNRSNKNNIYNKFLSCMDWFWQNGFIIDFDKELFTGNTFQCSYVDIDKVRKPNRFGKIYDFEIEHILHYKSDYKPLTSSILLLVLSYIRLNTFTRKSELSGHSEKSKKEKPEIFHMQYQTMAENLNLPIKLLSRAVHTLSSFGFIAIRPMERFQIETSRGLEWRTDDTIIVTPYKFITNQDGTFRLAQKEEYDFTQEIENGISFLKNKKYTIKKFYQK